MFGRQSLIRTRIVAHEWQDYQRNFQCHLEPLMAILCMYQVYWSKCHRSARRQHRIDQTRKLIDQMYLIVMTRLDAESIREGLRALFLQPWMEWQIKWCILLPKRFVHIFDVYQDRKYRQILSSHLCGLKRKVFAVTL